MGYCPSVNVGRCISCGGYPHIKHKGLFSDQVRLECECGVSGSWQEFGPWDVNTWNVASRGWVAVSKRLSSPPPPSR